MNNPARRDQIKANYPSIVGHLADDPSGKEFNTL